MTNDPLTRAQAAYDGFPDSFQSVVLATVDAEGTPHASYAPYVMDAERNIYCFLSGLSKHTANLQAVPKASAFFVEDEATASQIFARRRLNYECDVELLERESEAGQRAAKLQPLGG